MVPVERIELPTFRLRSDCTTAVLHRRLVLPPRIELGIQSYQDCVIPFNYRSVVGITGFEPMTSSMSRKHSTTELYALEPPEGFEPPTDAFEAHNSSPLSYGGNMAVGIGFEPMVPFTRYAGLANRCLQPLGQPTLIFKATKTGLMFPSEQTFSRCPGLGTNAPVTVVSFILFIIQWHEPFATT